MTSLFKYRSIYTQTKNEKYTPCLSQWMHCTAIKCAVVVDSRVVQMSTSVAELDKNIGSEVIHCSARKISITSVVSVA